MSEKKSRILLILVSLLMVISIVFNINLLNKNNILESRQAEIVRDLPPKITRIEFLSTDNKNVVKDNWATVPENGKLMIRITLEGKCTLIDMFITPTGTETYLLQKMIASVNVAEGEKEVEYIWEVPKGTMGHFEIIAYNGVSGTKSQIYNVYSE